LLERALAEKKTKKKLDRKRHGACPGNSRNRVLKDVRGKPSKRGLKERTADSIGPLPPGKKRKTLNSSRGGGGRHGKTSCRTQ